MNRANKKPAPPKPLAGGRIEVGETRLHARHEHNPPGSKLLRKAFKFSTGRRGIFKEAKSWYTSLKGETA